MPLTITSPSFADGAPIPQAFAQEGANRSPALAWTGARQDTKSFILVVEDHDAPVGTVTHWIVYDIPAGTEALEEAIGAADLSQGDNDMGHARYYGPKPPKGHGPHRYHFRLAALDMARLEVERGASRTSILAAARPHVLEEAELIGTYETA